MAKLFDECITRDADANRCGNSACLQSRDNGVRVCRAPAENRRVDQRKPDRATEVSHQVEKPAAIGDAGSCELAQRKSGWRQPAEHDCGASQYLRQHHLRPVGVRRMIPPCGRVCPGCSSIAEAAICSPGASLAVQFAAGFAVGSAGADTLQLVRQAGAALQRSETNPAHPAHAFVAADDWDARNRIRLASELQLAVPHQEVLFHYQPQVDLGTGELVGAEALLRWNHGAFGLHLPAPCYGKSPSWKRWRRYSRFSIADRLRGIFA